MSCCKTAVTALSGCSGALGSFDLPDKTTHVSVSFEETPDRFAVEVVWSDPKVKAGEVDAQIFSRIASMRLGAVEQVPHETSANFFFAKAIGRQDLRAVVVTVQHTVKSFDLPAP